MIHADLSRVVVTGASRGLGAALAHALVERGYRVFLAGRNEAELRQRAATIERDFNTSVGWSRADLRNAAGCRALVATAETYLGRVDVLINNAGVGWYKPFMGLPYDVVIDELTIHPAGGDY